MTHRIRNGFVACLAAAALLCAARNSVAAEVVAADQLLPDNTYAFISVPNITELKERFGESSLGRMRDDESLQPFWDDVDSALEEVGRQIEQEIGIDVEDLLAVPSGEFAFAVVPGRANKIGLVAMLDFGQSEDTVDQLLEKLAEAMEDQGATRSIEEVEDTRIVVYTFEDPNAEEQPRGPQNDFNQLVYFRKDQMIVFGSGVSYLQDILKRWDGQSDKSLASNDVYTYVREATSEGDEPPVITWYVDPIGLVKAAVMLGAQGNPQAAMAFTFLPALGLDRFKAMGGSMHVAVEGYDAISRTLFYVEQPPRGVLNVFQFPAADLTPPAWVTAEADAYFGANWDIQTAYETVEDLYDNFPLVGQGPGAFAALMDQAAEQEPNIHPKDDVIDLLTGRITVAAYMPEGESDEDGGEFAFALGIKDPAKAKALMEKIAKADTNLETREFQGETIYEVEAPGLQGGLSVVSLAVTRNDIMVSNQATVIEQVLRGNTPADSLAQSEEYKEVAAHFPAQMSLVSFERQDTQLEAAYEMLRSGELDMDVEIDFTKLPPFDEVRQYLPVSGSYAVPDKNGALMVSFTLSAEE